MTMGRAPPTLAALGAALVAGLLAVDVPGPGLPAGTAADTVVVEIAADSVDVLQGDTADLPLRLDLTGDGAGVAAWSAVLAWPPSGAGYAGAEAGDFGGSPTLDEADVDAGRLGASADRSSPVSEGRFTLLRLDLRTAESVAWGARLEVVPELGALTAGDGSDLLPRTEVRGAALCVAASGWGDVDASGDLGTSDVVQVLRAVVDLPVAPDADLSRADVDRSGDIGTGDAVQILRANVGLALPDDSRAGLSPVRDCGGVATGGQQVVTFTQGGGIDPDGYELVVDGSLRRSIGLNDTISVDGLPVGDHAFLLDDVSDNCTVGNNPHAISIVEGGSGSTTFSVDCDPRPVDVEVTASTSGTSPDADGYTAVLDGGTATASIDPDGSTVFADLEAGEHTVELTGIAFNCSPEGSNPRSVTVAGGETASVDFTIACTDTEGDLEVTASTSGTNPDADGYEVRLDGGAVTAALGPNGSVTLQDVPATEHELTLGGMARNCVASRLHPRTVDVPGGGTATASFEVRCVARGYRLDVDAGVPDDQLDLIERGLVLGQLFLADSVGGDLSAANRDLLKVKVVSSGQGHPISGACCATSTAGDSIHLFFDVAHTVWQNQDDDQISLGSAVDRRGAGAHEYGHAHQAGAGCVGHRGANLAPDWFLEGGANYVTYGAAIRRGAATRAGVEDLMLQAARGSGELDHPLSYFEDNASPWPGHVGYIALRMLLERPTVDTPDLRQVCAGALDAFQQGASLSEAFPQAFQSTFGQTLTDFYADFEAWRTSVTGS